MNRQGITSFLVNQKLATDQMFALWQSTYMDTRTTGVEQ